MAAERLHGDDTTVPVLARGKTDIARAWVYVRDDRPFAGPAPPAALFYYSRDRAGLHPQAHLAGYAGILQARCIRWLRQTLCSWPKSGFDFGGRLLGPCAPKTLVLADVEAAAKKKAQGKPAAVLSPLCLEAIQRIDKLFDIERDVNGCSADQRMAVRQELGAPLVANLHAWMSEDAESFWRNDVARRWTTC